MVSPMSTDRAVLVDTPPLFGALAVVRQVERAIDAITADLPPDVRAPLVEGARRDVEAAEVQADAWAPQLARWDVEAERIRAAARAETAALARPGETPYQTRARLLGRGDD